MKRRRLAIAAFLLCAALVMGIGFASTVDVLEINGNATYRPNSVVVDRTDAAIKFTGATPDDAYCTAATYTADSATMTVVINDLSSTSTTPFHAVATYKVTYETADLTYSKVTVNANALLTAGVGSSQTVPGFSINTVCTMDNAEDQAAGMLSPGNSMTVVVTVSYDPTAVTPAPTGPVTGTIGVTLTYTAVAA